MEVEESSEEDGFRPVVGKRRRKSASDGVGNGNEEENLLNSNKFSQLGANNNNNNGDAAGNDGVPLVPAAAKQEKTPPLVVKNMSLNQLMKVMSSCKTRPNYKLTPFGIKLESKSSGGFDTVRNHLVEKNVEFYTHSKRSERPYRVVIRGLPLMAPERVKQLIKEFHNLDALEVHAIKRKERTTSEETPYIVLFPKGNTNLRKLSEVKRFKAMLIRWEAYRNRKPNVTQCKNCLLLGHGTRNCHLKARCNKCGATHRTEDCKAEEKQANRCANCAGAHEATDRSCPKRAEFIRARQQAAKPNAPEKKAEKRSSTVPAFNLEEFPPLPGAIPGKDKPRPARSSGGTGSSAGASPKADEEEVLYSWEEVWRISLEYSARLKICRTRSDQVAVIGYMAQKYGSK